jgi:hypothetical protein
MSASIDQLIDTSKSNYVYLSKTLEAENCEHLSLQQNFTRFAESTVGDEHWEVVF